MNSLKRKKPILMLVKLAMLFVLSLVVMLLWNSLIPEIFGLKTVNYPQALGLFFLSRILFGNFGLGMKKGRFANPEFKDKIMNMTTEERLLFKEEWKKRHGR